MLRYAFKSPLSFLIFIAFILFLIVPDKAFGQRIDVKTYIPKNAKIYTPVLKKQIEEYFADFPYYSYFGGLIEQESCIALTWNSCWNPKTTLNTKREYGAGLGQLTKAFRPDGQVRFDSLQSIREEHYLQLQQLSWSNILLRPDLQMRAIILMSQDNYKRLWMIKDPYSHVAFTDSAYNGGLGGVYQDRRLCGLEPHCNPDLWFNNVQNTCSKSKIAIYGHQSPCDINRTHVTNVLKLRMDKYAPLLDPKKPAPIASASVILVKPVHIAPVVVKPVPLIVKPISIKPVIKETASTPIAKPVVSKPVVTHWWDSLF